MASSQSEIEYCISNVQQGLRLDGRALTDFRPLEVELGTIAQASGSARLRIGDTDVIVGVKAEVESVSKPHSDGGRLQVTVECSACASPEYEGRGGDAWGQQLASALQAALAPASSSGSSGSPASELLRSLVIIPGKAVWVLYVDALVLNDGGGVLGAISAAALAALSATRLPRVIVSHSGEESAGGQPEIELEDDGSEGVPLQGLGHLPVVVTCAVLGPVGLVADPGLLEERAARCTLHVAVDASGNVCGIQQEGKAGLSPADLLALTDMATALGPGLLGGLGSHLTHAQAAMVTA